ncbi:MAG TPA: hypothetical protein VFX12_11905 [Vicinamibacterales bacterium]|nr:hypothetical protein [Vicinamibacterales bacterium]
MIAFVMALVLAGPPAQQPQEARPKVPKDSVQLVIAGCLKGRVLSASSVRKTDVMSGPEVSVHTFRLAGKKDVMKTVKANDGRLVEVTGLVRKADVTAPPGMRIGNTKIVVGGGYGSADPNRRPDPAEGVVVMDVDAVTATGGSCSGGN